MSNTTYRPIGTTVEAMQLPRPNPNNDDAMRAVAVWMVENGYEDTDTHPDELAPNEVHDGRVLPEYGINYLTFKDDDGNERDVRPGEWLVKADCEWRVYTAAAFSAAYEPAS